MKVLKLTKVSQSELDTMRSFAEGQMKNAIAYTAQGIGNPMEDLLKSIEVLKAIAIFEACDAVAEGSLPEAVPRKPKKVA